MLDNNWCLYMDKLVKENEMAIDKAISIDSISVAKYCITWVFYYSWPSFFNEFKGAIELFWHVEYLNNLLTSSNSFQMNESWIYVWLVLYNLFFSFRLEMGKTITSVKLSKCLKQRMENHMLLLNGFIGLEIL